jgi:hypothetical protein
VALPSDRGTLILYVRSGPPEFAGDFSSVDTSVWRGTLSRIIPVNALGRAPERKEAADENSERVPRQQIQCVQLVLDIAKRYSKQVRVVDVNHRRAIEPPLTPGLVDKPFPILVRPDGQQLVGEAEFTPGRIRKFLRDTG